MSQLFLSQKTISKDYINQNAENKIYHWSGSVCRKLVRMFSSSRF